MGPLATVDFLGKIVEATAARIDQEHLQGRIRVHAEQRLDEGEHRRGRPRRWRRSWPPRRRGWRRSSWWRRVVPPAAQLAQLDGPDQPADNGDDYDQDKESDEEC